MRKSIFTLLILTVVSVGSLAAEKREALLELQAYSWSHEDDSNYAIVVGQVKNISKKSIDAIEAVANFSDAKGTYISNNSSLIDYNPLLPDQNSPFKVMVPWNPAFKNLQIEFKQLMRGKLEHKEKKK